MKKQMGRHRDRDGDREIGKDRQLGRDQAYESRWALP